MAAVAKKAVAQAPAKAKKFEIPKKLAQAADMLYTKRLERLALQKQVDEIAKQEGLLREHLINNLPKSAAQGVSGQVASARIETKDIPQVSDWPKFYAYIIKEKAFDLLQRRVNETAIQERLDAKKKVPGITIFKAVKVSSTKV